ncbi:GumC family protein [Roseibium sp.]|uniref:GumC family protein n=1 Tax=Roseibium sp. TaxID=1936156 RepID=UPI0032673898
MNGYEDDWDSPEWDHVHGRRTPQGSSRRSGRPERGRDDAQLELVRLAGQRRSGSRKYDRQVPEPGDPAGPADPDRPARRRFFGGRPDPRKNGSEALAPEPAYPESTYTVSARRQVARNPLIDSRYQAEEPILDTRTIIAALYESRRLIAVIVVLCMALGAAATLMLPRKFTANASLYFDPTRLQLSWDGQATSQISPQTVSALVNSQIQILTSTTVMRDVVDMLSLTDDPEFGGAQGGEAGKFAAAASVAEAVTANRVDDSFVIAVRATTSSPEKSASIANAAVESLYRYETTTASDQYSTITSTLDKRLEDLRAKAFATEKAVEDYRARNDLVASKGVLISDDRLSALNTALVVAEQKTIEARARVDAASRLSLQDAVAGTSDTDVSSATLVDLRRQYATAAAQLGSLRSQLGSRHPSIGAAEASLSGLGSEIRQELKRIASTAQTELSQAQKAQDEIAKELTAQKALKRTNSPNQAALENLVLQAATARNIYEAMLTRTREANEEFNSLQSNVRVISQAEVPIYADGPGRSTLLIGGLFGGAVLGFGLGLFLALARRLIRHPGIRSYFTVAD